MAPYPTPENPSNPFAGTVGGGFTTFVYQLGGLIAQVVLVPPVVVTILLQRWFVRGLISTEK